MGSDHRAIYTGEIKKKERMKRKKQRNKERERKERRLCIVLQRYCIEEGKGWRRKGRVGIQREGKEKRKEKTSREKMREEKRREKILWASKRSCHYQYFINSH